MRRCDSVATRRSKHSRLAKSGNAGWAVQSLSVCCTSDVRFAPESDRYADIPRSRIWAIIGFMYHSQVRELMRRVRRTFGFRCGESRSRLVWSAALNAVPQRLAFRRRAATGGDPHDGHFATQCLGQSPFIPGVLMSETIKMSYTSSQACRTAASAVSSDGLPLNTIRPWPIT
jgi:hypothetical protein